MARYLREEFNRAREFVVTRSFVFAARGYVPGQPFDKTAATSRRLRQLYDQRKIAMAPLNGHGLKNGLGDELTFGPGVSTVSPSTAKQVAEPPPARARRRFVEPD